MVNAPTVSLVAMAIAAVVIVAAMVLRLRYRFRHWFRPRKAGESLQQFAARAQLDGALDGRARDQMWGEHSAAAALVQFVALLAVGYGLVRWPAALWPFLAYVIAGYWFTRRVAREGRQSDYGRLSWSDRTWHRMAYVWIWPVFLFARFAGAARR